MSTPDTTDATAPEAPKKKGALLFILVGAIVGTGAGLFGVAPMLIAKPATPDAAAHDSAAAPKASVLTTIDNLVLNPAESEGTRFLMVSAAIEVRSGDVETTLKARNAEVRDRILAVLGRRTVVELTDMSLRDAIKKEVLDSVGVMFAKGDVVRLYFPQFVVQ